jgi:hypothetical protein
MGRSGLGDNTANVGTTSEEDLIPSLSEQCLCLSDTSLDNVVAGGVETGFANLLHHGGAVGSIFGGLDDDGVTGGNSTNNGAQGQLEGEVESTKTSSLLDSTVSYFQDTLLGGNVPDDQHSAQWVLSDLGVHELEGKIHIIGLLILDPFVKVAGGEDNIVEQPTALGDLDLEARLVQVF